MGPHVLGRWLATVLVVCCGTVFVGLRSLPLYHQHLRPEFDELAYLELANDMAEAGGWSTILGRCWTGEYREANRHPLYLLMLGSLAERDPSFYPRAKLATWLMGIGAVAVTLAVSVRVAGPPAAGLIAMLLGCNGLWKFTMSSIAVEMPLFALLTIAWFLVCFANSTWRWFAGAGLLTGLAYLFKGTALLVLPALASAFVFAFVVARKSSRPTLSGGAAFLLAFLLAASPLLVRNVRVYGAPFYNVNSKYMWLDNWSQVALVDDADLARQSPAEFVARRGVGALGLRLASGLAREGSYLVVALSPVSGSVSPPVLAVGGAILLLGITGVRHLPDAFGGLFTWFLVAAFLVALALHTPNASHPRFQLTLAPILMITAVLELRYWVERWLRPAQRPALAGVLSTGALIVLVGLAIATLAVDPTWARPWPPRWFAPADLADDERELAEWMQQDLTEADLLVVASGAPFSPFWYCRIPGRYHVFPAGVPSETFAEWVDRSGATCAVLGPAPWPNWAVDWSRGAGIDEFYRVDSVRRSLGLKSGGNWRLERQVGRLWFYRRKR